PAPSATPPTAAALHGALPICAIDLPLSVEFLGVASYGDDTNSSGAVKITQDLSTSIEGKDVLLIEDIVDTGLTLAFLLRILQARDRKSTRLNSSHVKISYAVY